MSFKDDMIPSALGGLEIERLPTELYPESVNQDEMHLVASSRETGIEFVAFEDVVSIVRTHPDKTVLCRLMAEIPDPIQACSMIVGILNGQEVLGIAWRYTPSQCRFLAWSTAAIVQEATKLTPLHSTEDKPQLLELNPIVAFDLPSKAPSSIALHPQMCLIAVGNADPSITLFFEGTVHWKKPHRASFSSITSLEFIQSKPQLVDICNYDINIYLTFTCLTYGETGYVGSIGLWKLDPRQIDDSEYNGKIIYEKLLRSERGRHFTCGALGVVKHCAIPVTEAPWPQSELLLADADGYGQSLVCIDVRNHLGGDRVTSDPQLWLAAQQVVAYNRIDQVKGPQPPQVSHKLKNCLLVILAHHEVYLCDAANCHCRCYAQVSANLPINCMEIVEPLGLVVCLTDEELFFLRIVEYMGFIGLVNIGSCTFPEALAGWFTVRPEQPGQEEGAWIVKVYYYETDNFDDSDTDRSWSLSELFVREVRVGGRARRGGSSTSAAQKIFGFRAP